MRKRFHIRISDSVLDEKDWPIAAIYIRHSFNIITIMTLIKYGVYGFPNMINWDLPKLFNWLNYDSTGQHPEEYHDIGLYIPEEDKFYPCDYSFDITTIDNKWIVCNKCNKTTIHNRNDECMNCMNNKSKQEG